MRRARQSRKTARRGAVLFWLVVSLTVVVGIVAINLDGGRLLEERRRVQAAADAAALAAGADLYANYGNHQGLDPMGTALLAAQAAAAANGYPASAVTVHAPPESGTFARQAGYAEVILQTALDATFGSIFTSTTMPVTGRAVARGQPMKIGLILLQPSGADSFLNRAITFTLINQPIIVDSSDLAAFDQASFGVTIASRYDITGGYINPGGGVLVGTIRTGQAPAPDPLAFLPIPDSSLAPVASNSPLTINAPLLPTILQPGIYQGGLNITGNSLVTMMAGVYIMQGGGFQVGGMATVLGDQVMIYNTTSSAYAPGPISVISQGKVGLVAPFSGTYQGISIFQDRSLATPLSLTGYGLAAITGVVYAAQAPVTLTGSALAGVDILGGAYVVNSMTVQGAGAIQVDLGLTSPRVPDVRLVE